MIVFVFVFEWGVDEGKEEEEKEEVSFAWICTDDGLVQRKEEKARRRCLFPPPHTSTNTSPTANSPPQILRINHVGAHPPHTQPLPTDIDPPLLLTLLPFSLRFSSHDRVEIESVGCVGSKSGEMTVEFTEGGGVGSTALVVGIVVGVVQTTDGTDNAGEQATSPFSVRRTSCRSLFSSDVDRGDRDDISLFRCWDAGLTGGRTGVWRR